MDILYYSNYCKHSKEVLDFLVKHDLVSRLNCLCVDKRKVDPTTSQIHLVLENGSTVLMPPNIHSVPSLMLLKENYRVIMGNGIKGHFQSYVQEANSMATQGNGEPMSFSFGGSRDVVSENFTMFNATVDELSAKGNGGQRNMHKYVSATGTAPNIQTPPETYKSEKMSSDITVDSIQQERNQDMGQQNNQQIPFLPQY
jgi:hypothetical protein